MREIETIEVYIRTRNGETTCICQLSNKGCDRKCKPDIVMRDRFRDWRTTMIRDKYGK